VTGTASGRHSEDQTPAGQPEQVASMNALVNALVKRKRHLRHRTA
jgi:hypothetical protein